MQSRIPASLQAILIRGDWKAPFHPSVLHVGEAIYFSGQVKAITIDFTTDSDLCFHATFHEAAPVWAHLEQRFRGVSLSLVCNTHGDRKPCEYTAAALFAITKMTTGGLQRPPRPANRPGVVDRWLQGLTKPEKPEATEPADPNISRSYPQQVLYVLKSSEYGDGRLCDCLHLMQARKLVSGGFGLTKPAPVRSTGWQPPKYFARTDITLVRKLMLMQTPTRGFQWRLTGEKEWEEILQAALATGRCFYHDISGAPLSAGPPRQATLVWHRQDNGEQRPGFDISGQVDAYSLAGSLHYIDCSLNLCGIVESPLAPAQAARWLTGPLLSTDEISSVVESLERRPELATLPKPKNIVLKERTDCRPTPTLTLLKSPLIKAPWCRSAQFLDHLPTTLNVARLSFTYEGHTIQEEAPFIEISDGDSIVRIHRSFDLEEQCRRRLIEFSLRRLEDIDFFDTEEHGEDFAAVQGSNAVTDPAIWWAFVSKGLAQLRSEGWEIEVDPSFDFEVIEPDVWYTELEEGSGSDMGWFDLEMGVEHEGHRHNLLPAITAYLKANPSLTLAELAEQSSEEDIFLPLEGDNTSVAIPAARLHAVLAAVIELWDTERPSRSPVRLHKLRAAELAAVAAEDTATQITHRHLAVLGEKLAGFQGVKPVRVPRAFQGELRPYQRQGLDWLQFLRDLQLGGILADDMGLGKTIQTLANLQKEKQAGRAKLPSLIVAPTSVLANWSHEVQKFTPRLKSMILRGPDRKASFSEIPNLDLVFTSYPLLVRDGDEYLKHSYHYVILDEAQFIKNPKSKAAITARNLQANHRLCLTGTPVENHLGELWSLFQFLVPGYLGEAKSFRRIYRNPIERTNDEQRRQHLFRRVAPMLLRRTKDAVLQDLPPKTEIVQRVTLNKAQADLYEAVRSTMDKKIREQIQERGVARSHIIILDAMLKLRQVCCHPQLLKLKAARKVKDSAKLAHLLEMLDEMLEEGRRILLFSQFTSMLALIEEQLNARAISYVKLTGNTNDRDQPVKDFQEGRVSLFLISLKAGGTGLNLTAADTVIHYDPWWNPAVENQATDRAHRIGQNKRVFVYKLIMENTIEEKIVALQSKKKELVDGLLSSGTNRAGLSEEDLRYLFSAEEAPGT